MWKRLVIALLCAAVAFGFNSNAPSTGGAGGGAPVVNPPGGANNYLPIAGPTWTGAGAGPTLNLTGAAPALTFNGVPIGGTCTGSDFINAISASGVVSCATPAGGGGGLPTPVSVANGGLGQGNAPTAGQILVAQSATLYGNVPMSGDATIAATGAITVTSIGGVAGPFAPFTNPANGQNNYAPINAPAFTGLTTASQMQVANTLSAPTANFGSVTVQTGGVLMLAGSAALFFNGFPMGGTCAAGSGVTSISATGVPTCTAVLPPAGSITDPMLANAYSGVGACTPGQFATALNRNAPPSCATPPGAANFAPLTNPVGGQNNYAPIAAPTFTGTVTAPGLNLTAAPPSLLFNGTPMGGNCPAGEAVVTLSNTGVPTCATVAAGGVTVAATPPANPQLGALWFDSVGLQLYIWFTDANGSRWIPTVNQPPSQVANVTVGTTAPTAPAVGALWFNTDNVQMYIWYSSGAASQWVPVAHP